MPSVFSSLSSLVSRTVTSYSVLPHSKLPSDAFPCLRNGPPVFLSTFLSPYSTSLCALLAVFQPDLLDGVGTLNMLLFCHSIFSLFFISAFSSRVFVLFPRCDPQGQ